jgi:ABC-type dipeptide/oligopeptide/nickel transport system permease component
MRLRPVLLVARIVAVVLTMGASSTAHAVETPHPVPSTRPAWLNTSSMATARLRSAAVRLQDGRVLVAGGSATNRPNPISNAELFDPTTNMWKAAAHIPERRDMPRTILLKDGRVLLVGGFAIPSATTSAFLYAPNADSWSKAGSLAVDHLGGETLTLLADGRVLLAGGDTGVGPTADVEIYDPAANSWIEAAPLLEPLSDQDAVLLPNGRVLVFGGTSAMGSSAAAVASVYLYDPSGNNWSELSHMPVPRSGGFAYQLPDGVVLVLGGVTGGALGEPLNSAYYFDVSRNAWSQAPAAMVTNAVQLSDGRVVALGYHSAGSQDVIPRIFDPLTARWQDGNVPPTRLSAASHLVALDDGRILVYETGALGAVQPISRAYVYDPNVPPVAAPALPATPSGLYAALAALVGVAVAIAVAAGRRMRRAWTIARPLLLAAFQVGGLFALTYGLVYIAGLQPLPLSAADVPGGTKPQELYLLNQPLGQVLLQTTTLSLILCALAAGWATAVGLGGAVLVTTWRGRWFEPAAAAAALLWVTPTFLLAILVQELQAQIFGHSGLVVAAGFGDVNPAQVFWAAVVLGLRPAAYLYRQTRAALNLEVDQNYARTGLAKGLSWRRVVSVHVLRVSASGLIASWLNAIRLMIGALPLVEFFFGYPGLGRVLILAMGISQQTSAEPVHEPLVIGIVVVMGLMLALVEAFSRLLQQRLDPRLREARAR